MSRWTYDDGTLLPGLWCAQTNHPEVPEQVREQVAHLSTVNRDYHVSTETDEVEVTIFDGCVAWRAK